MEDSFQYAFIILVNSLLKTCKPTVVIINHSSVSAVIRMKTPHVSLILLFMPEVQNISEMVQLSRSPICQINLLENISSIDQ